MTPAVSRKARRALNAAIKLRAGLTLRGENISPEIPTDLFRAAQSVYGFFAGYVPGARVLDLGCGAGYGAATLLEGGSRGDGRRPRSAEHPVCRAPVRA